MSQGFLHVTGKASRALNQVGRLASRGRARYKLAA